MHIVYVSRELVPSLRCGGIGSYVWDMARHVVRRGHRATVICASDDTRQLSDETTEGVRTIRLCGGDFAVRGIEPAGANPLARRWREMRRYRSYRRSVADCLDGVISSHGADIVEFAEYGNEAAEWVCRSRPVPMVVRIHGPASRRGGRRIRWRPWRWIRHRRAFREYDAVRLADAVSCPSSAMADLVRDDGCLGSLPIEIIPNAVDCAFWSMCEERVVGDAAAKEPVIFTAATVVEPKGIAELVEAVGTLRSQGCRAHLIVAGKWGKLGRLLRRRLSEDRELAEWLSLPGHMTREQLRDFYRCSSVVCLPSWWENCPCSCLEAMASGALVLGSSAGGMAEIIRNGHDGFLVPPRQAGVLAERLTAVLNTPPDERQLLRENARERIRSTFDVNVIVPRMLEFYERVITSRSRRGHSPRECA